MADGKAYDFSDISSVLNVLRATKRMTVTPLFIDISGNNSISQFMAMVRFNQYLG